MVALSMFFAYQTAKLAYFKSGYSLVCQANDSKTNPFLRGDLVLLLVVRDASRWASFLDTVFFVLRKKNDHISFLHVLHHTLALITCVARTATDPPKQGESSTKLKGQ
ncbi:hypothetical protein MRX96_038168 [Rhipicephalus microplus]